jgi:fucose permease
MSQYGTYEDVVIVQLMQSAPKSFTEAASIWIIFVTAYGATSLNAPRFLQATD